ncbi:MAG: Resolvase, terminal domain [Dehalococcoidia bacterium]|nr:Resolvase, terminal domain [Dehalococcoidia bacterium]
MGVALYTRVSTDDQNPETQLQELQDWAESRGHTVVSQFSDVASGARRRAMGIGNTWEKAANELPEHCDKAQR